MCQSFAGAVSGGAILLLAATLNAQNLYVANYYGSNIGEYGLDGSTATWAHYAQRFKAANL